MKIYTVTCLSESDYDFVAYTTKYGAFQNFNSALNRLKEVVEDFKKKRDFDIKEYSDPEKYPDEGCGGICIEEDFEHGYWSCLFGLDENRETYQFCIDEYEIEDYPKVSIDTHDGYVLDKDFKNIINDGKRTLAIKENESKSNVNKVMTRDEMIAFIKENPNIKIKHEYFSPDEYIYSKENGDVYTEEGYLFEDWYNSKFTGHNGIRMRKGDGWETGWSLYKENEDGKKN